MSKVRKFVPRVWIFLVVCLLLFGSGTAGGALCLCADNCRHAHNDLSCSHFPINTTGHDHGSQSNGLPADSSCCHCSVLPRDLSSSYVPMFGALTSLIWMHGAAHVPCLLDSAVNPEILVGGGRFPPLISDLNPSIVPLQTVFLLM
jgi:hypothetical protein